MMRIEYDECGSVRDILFTMYIPHRHTQHIHTHAHTYTSVFVCRERVSEYICVRMNERACMLMHAFVLKRAHAYM